MNKRVTGLALAGAIAVGGLGAGAVIAPALASESTAPSATDETTDESAADRLAGRVTAIREAGGHGDGGHGGRRLDLLAAADALGVSPDELRTGLADGSTLVEIAEAEGVPSDDLVDALVEAARSRLDELVASGELTQTEADSRALGLQERIETLVEQGGLGQGGHGPGLTDRSAPTPSASQSST